MADGRARQVERGICRRSVRQLGSVTACNELRESFPEAYVGAVVLATCVQSKKEYAPGMRAKVEVMTGCVEPREEAD